MNVLSVAAGVRRAGDGLPVGLVRLDRLRASRLRAGDHAGAAAGDRVRPLDGLRGVHAQPHQGALPRHRRQPRGGGAGPVREREDDLERRDHHGRRLRDLRRHGRAADQGDRRRPRDRDLPRRDGRAADPRPDDDGASRRRQLVAAEVAGPGSCPTWTSSPRPAAAARPKKSPRWQLASVAGVDPVVIAGGCDADRALQRRALKVDAVELGAHAVRAALERTALEPDYVAVGNVLQAANGQNPGRRAACRAAWGAPCPGSRSTTSAWRP